MTFNKEIINAICTACEGFVASWTEGLHTLSFLFISGSPESALERYVSSTEHKRALVRQAAICVKEDAYPFLIYAL